MKNNTFPKKEIVQTPLEDCNFLKRSPNQLISTHVDDGQLIKYFISDKYMNKHELNKLSKDALIELILRKNVQKQEKSPNMSLKELSTYLQDAKKLGYTWLQLMTKSSRGVILKKIQRERNIKKTTDLINEAKKENMKYLKLDKMLKRKERMIMKQHKKILTPKTKLSNEFNFDDSIFDTTSNDQPLFKITEIGNTVNKKFNAYTNEFKINVRKNFIGDKNDVFSVFEKMVEMTIKKRQLKGIMIDSDW